LISARRAFIDVDDPEFMNPGDEPRAIRFFTVQKNVDNVKPG
jgi:hypothetical protein